jgi:hypothetical protein
MAGLKWKGRMVMVPATKYVAWKEGYRAVVEPETAYEELQRIREEHGGYLTAEIVVNAARPKESPIHEEVFRFGQRRAAEEFYKARARMMMACVIVTDDEEEDAVPIRAFVHVVDTSDEENHVSVYTDMEEALNDPEYRAQILQSAWSEARSFRRKYERVSEYADARPLAKVIKVIDQQLELAA